VVYNGFVLALSSVKYYTVVIITSIFLWNCYMNWFIY